MFFWLGVMFIGFFIEQFIQVMWFKKLLKVIVNWGGNFNEVMIIEKKENEKGVWLSLRKLFVKWQEVVWDKFVFWEVYEIKVVEKFRDWMIKEEMECLGEVICVFNIWLAVILNKELDQIIYIVFYDLQELLWMISSFVKFFEWSVLGKLMEDENFFFGWIILVSD